MLTTRPQGQFHYEQHLAKTESATAMNNMVFMIYFFVIINYFDSRDIMTLCPLFFKRQHKIANSWVKLLLKH
jgi:hypothetical protein